MTKVNDTSAETGKKPNGEGAPAEGAEKDTQKEPTVGEVIAPEGDDDKGQDKKPDAKPETVGLDKFLDVKKENKELRQALKDLQKKVTEGAEGDEISDDIDALAKEFDIKPEFLKKLKGAVLKGIEKPAADDKVQSRLDKLEAKERREKIDTAFKKEFSRVMENMPEYKDVVNAEVIKKLTLDPDNSDKTFAEIIEETYGGSIRGKKTIEPTRPRGGKEPEEVDFAKANRDPKYFDEIMANPALKKKYNEGLHTRIPL